MSQLETKVLIDFYKTIQRQGPGSIKDTLNAFGLTGLSKHEKLQIADIGCGTGGQTLTLAHNTNGQITALDLFPQFLDKLNQNAKKARLQERIKTIEKSMENLPFESNSLDIIWSEGAIYNLGFEKGVREWKKYLKPRGFLAVSEITWTTNSRPKEIEDFWNKEYSEIDTAANKIKVLEKNGYSLIGYFLLSQNSWTDHFYKPMEKQFPAFLEKHKHSEIAKNIVKEHKEEIQLYQKYKDYYSYGFYIAKKIGKTLK